MTATEKALREALFAFAQLPTVGWNDAICPDVEYSQPVTNGMILRARAALAPPSPEVEREYRVTWHHPHSKEERATPTYPLGAAREFADVAMMVTTAYAGVRIESRTKAGPWEPISA